MLLSNIQTSNRMLKTNLEFLVLVSYQVYMVLRCEIFLQWRHSSLLDPHTKIRISEATVSCHVTCHVFFSLSQCALGKSFFGCNMLIIANCHNRNHKSNEECVEISFFWVRVICEWAFSGFRLRCLLYFPHFMPATLPFTNRIIYCINWLFICLFPVLLNCEAAKSFMHSVIAC